MKIIKFFILIIMSFNLTYTKLKIGVSMLPYYSFAKNIVKDKAEVISILPVDVDVHSYQVGINELKKINELDVLIINGTGIDDHFLKLIKSSNNKKIKIINASKNLSLIVNGNSSSKNINTHTFIAANASIKQIFNIAEELGNIDKTNNIFYLNNAKAYAREISTLKNKYFKEINKLKKEKNLNVATTHGGYDYLLNELGIKVSVIIEPSDNVKVGANDLKKGIDLIKKENIKILFESEGIQSPYSTQIKKETGVIVKQLSHMTNGKYEKDTFIKDLERNLKTIYEGIKEIK